MKKSELRKMIKEELESLRSESINLDMEDGEDYYFLTYTKNGKEYDEVYSSKSNAMSMLKPMIKDKEISNVSLEYQTTKKTKMLYKRK
jgi:hypothetical protein